MKTSDLKARAAALNFKLAAKKYEKGQKFKYRNQEVEIAAVRKDGSGVTIRATGSGITKNLSAKDADKMLKAAGAKVAIVNSPREMEAMFEQVLTALNHIEASAEDYGFSPDGAEKARAVMLRAYREWTQAKRNLTASMDKQAWRNQKKFPSLEDAIAFLRKFEGKYFTEFGLDKEGYDDWVLSYTYEKW